MNLLPNKNDWITKFISSNRHHDLLIRASEYSFDPIYKFDKKLVIRYNKTLTPREDDVRCKIFDLQPFYILDYINENNQNEIYDIGCGINFFKKFYNMIGIDINSVYADIVDEFNLDFCLKNQKKLSNVFSINAIHFCECKDLYERINMYFTLSKIGGYSYLALNIARPIELTYGKSLTYDENQKIALEVTKNIKEKINNISGTILLYEDLSHQYFDEGLNGNIRILMKREL